MIELILYLNLLGMRASIYSGPQPAVCQRLCRYVLQAVSKPQIAFEGKAQPDEKTQHIR
jgi:hypothetical protein